MKSRQNDRIESELWDAWENFMCDLMRRQRRRWAEWTEHKDIIEIIDRAGRELPGVHQAFLPGGGCIVEIARACPSFVTPGMQLECRHTGQCLDCLPMSLICVSFATAPELSYLDLRLRELAPLDETNVRRDRKEEWYGTVIGANGKERRDGYTRLLRGRMMMFARGAYGEELDGEFERWSRKEFYRRQVRANGGWL